MILVSACLLGENCKYNGKNNKNFFVIEFLKNKKYLKVCPEQLAGLGTPRLPCEILNKKVISISNEDMTDKFQKGADDTLEIAIINNCTSAILKEKSPSCGVNYVYDGTFSGKLINNMGITTTLLFKHGLKISSEKNIEEYMVDIKRRYDER